MASNLDNPQGDAAIQKNSLYDARNYRSIHTTAQVTKATEQVLAILFLSQLICMGSFGHNQFAYMLKRKTKDALAHFVTTWIFLLKRNRKICVDCSNVCGSFDDVNSQIFDKTACERNCRGHTNNIKILSICKENSCSCWEQFSQDIVIRDILC